MSIKRLSFLCVVAVLWLFQVSCSAPAADLPELDLPGLETPIWSEDDLGKQESAILLYETTVQMKPPFYKGSMPISFVAGKKPMAVGEMTNAYFDFGDFSNDFVYLDPAMQFSGIAQGAVTTDRSGRLLAEARMVRLLSDKGNQFQGIEIEEFHYNKDGGLVFTCTSTIDFPQGFKQSESNVLGKKQRDYYFIWPVRGF